MNLVPVDDTRTSGRIGPLVVEVLVVCDKEFSDIFNQDRNKIVDYLTMYFWDVNVRYRTLPSVDISFRVTGVVLISSKSQQSFIEQARDSNGQAGLGNILNNFRSWVYANSAGLPKFDLAIAITNTNVDSRGGVAYGNSVCNVDHNNKMNGNVMVFYDEGGYKTVATASHEMAHTLGAPHDNEVGPACTYLGYIMSGSTTYPYFFSPCSNEYITKLVQQPDKTCLQRLDEPGAPAINPDFTGPKPPTIEDQCRAYTKRSDAFISQLENKNMCQLVSCNTPFPGGWYPYNDFSPMDNSPCPNNNGRCFRGKCRQPSSLLVNVGTQKCALPDSAFGWTTTLFLRDCPTSGVALDRWVVEDSPSGKLLQTPYSTLDATENSERCMWTGTAEGNGILTDRCNQGQNPWHGWDMIPVGVNGGFLLKHRLTQRCAAADGRGGLIKTSAVCNSWDNDYIWKLEN